MSPAKWQRGPRERADLTLRCSGKRILAVLAGEPARIHGVRELHSSGDYLLKGEAFVLDALVTSQEAEVGPIEMNEMTVECPNHKGGHFISGVKLRQELAEARRRGGDRGISVQRVVTPLLDGTRYDEY